MPRALRASGVVWTHPGREPMPDTGLVLGGLLGASGLIVGVTLA